MTKKYRLLLVVFSATCLLIGETKTEQPKIAKCCPEDEIFDLDSMRCVKPELESELEEANQMPQTLIKLTDNERNFEVVEANFKESDLEFR